MQRSDEPAIGREEFRSLVARELKRIEAGEELTTEDSVTMVRLWNTIEADRLRERDPLFTRYADAFFPAQVARVAELLGAGPTKGMAVYSREHDLYLGGPDHAPSRYRIEDG